MFQIEFDGKTQILTKDSYTIGRAADCDIKIGNENGRISRQHARLVRTATGWDVIDLGSQNGTFVNGEQVDRRILAVGDELRFNGSEVAKFGLAPEGHSESTLTQDQTNPGGGYGRLASRIDHIESRLEEISAQSSAFHESQAARLEELAVSIVSSSKLAPRIQALEARAEHSATIDNRVFEQLTEMEGRARKAVAVLLGLAGLVAMTSFGSLVFQESERQEFREAFMDALGGPAGIATLLSGALLGGGAVVVRPSGGKDAGATGRDLRLGGQEPEIGVGDIPGRSERDRFDG